MSVVDREFPAISVDGPHVPFEKKLPANSNFHNFAMVCSYSKHRIIIFKPYYAQLVREEFIQSNPKRSQNVLKKLTSTLWRQLSPDEKNVRPYHYLYVIGFLHIICYLDLYQIKYDIANLLGCGATTNL